MAEKPNRRWRPNDEDDDDRPKKRRRDEPDGDDDDEERPRKKKKAAGGNGLLLFGIFGAGVLVVGIVLVIVLASSSRDDKRGANADQEGSNAGKAPKIDSGAKPAGWIFIQSGVQGIHVVPRHLQKRSSRRGPLLRTCPD
jgi:hypothetical protein